jgi:hypothetical protein
MPGCVLRATGEDFRPNDFLNGNQFAACNVFHKGERKAEDRVWASSGFTVIVSEAPGNNSPRQVRDAVEFLRAHEEELSRLLRCPGLEDVRLDFGISRSDALVASYYLPPELLRLAGLLGIGVEISSYGGG